MPDVEAGRAARGPGPGAAGFDDDSADADDVGGHDKAVADRAEAYGVALRLLVRREHSRFELARKLRSRGFEGEVVEQALDALADEGAQSDARFASEYAQSRAARGYGPDRIERELRERGIAGQAARDSVWGLDEDWDAAMEAARSKRFGPQRPVDFKTRSKQMRFLLNRGFPADMIRARME